MNSWSSATIIQNVNLTSASMTVTYSSASDVLLFSANYQMLNYDSKHDIHEFQM